MIVQENYYEDDGRIFTRTYSDAGFVIEQVGTGFRFAEAIDPHDSGRTYIETSDPVDHEPLEAAMEGKSYDANAVIQAALILLGEEE